ncbi:hypothetical protein HER10_EVM0001924 [Colletotrichum scovillei]|uniref:uncharacterized protein n=1 Tax=Colletotrichum scovillei TaxID=1209932 RepID=UPI0015C342BE|nr:uncharacterized protein HER10_EVM0001924 [Colletotrichum scovillei]KAF4783930.1 hypothetical protein HER10_EVM0001924 [Colletotrichum scovillei]
MATDNIHHRMVTNPKPQKSGLHPRLNQQRHGEDVKHQPTVTSVSSKISWQGLQEHYDAGSHTSEGTSSLPYSQKGFRAPVYYGGYGSPEKQDAMRGQHDLADDWSASSVGDPDTQVNDPRETTQTHYTISEDEIGKGSQNKLAALALKMGAPQRIEHSTHLGTAQPIPTASTAQLENECEAPNLRQTGSPAPGVINLTSQQKPHSHNPSSTVQRQKQPERARRKWEAAQGTQNIKQSHGYRYSPVDVSEAPVNDGEAYLESGLSSELRACAATPNISEHILMAVSEAGEVPDGAFSEPLSAEETSLLYYDVFQKMKQRIQLLEAANDELSRILTPQVNVRVQIFHLLDNKEMGESVYLSEPKWMVICNDIGLVAQFLLVDPEGYIEKEKDISFVIYKCYSEEHQRDAVEKARKSSGSLPTPEPAYQDILLTSEEMVEALEAFFALHPASRQEFPKLYTHSRLSAPFVWWYRHRRSSKIETLPRRQAELVNALVSHIEEAYARLYDNIEEQLSRGYVSNISMEFLFRPGQVLVSFTDGVPQGHIALSHPYAHVNEPSDIFTLPKSKGRQDISGNNLSQWTVSSRTISYRGEFVRVVNELKIGLETETENGEIDISSLPVIPLEYASHALRERLMRRGQTFWKCREKRLVSCQGTGQIHSGERFMIDFETYTSFHPQNQYTNKDKLVPEPGLPTNGSEPRLPEIYLFPNLVPGFDLRRKKWVDVEVDQIRDVAWNDQAFNSLVADEDMKTLILALVTNQIDAKRGTDVIDNKGNGLIMLLHGSPGTGKTFTAESVAEIAKKPLYSVTCGDIGTNPADVEKYLESVFHLGKIWDCVVLLDEAEVFLEQRTLQDLQRNALVSVFLRALEYYDGILILTTNRVGTFDEAFKSRIQLALRYQRLEAYQRKQIWKNFFERLKSIGEEDSIDFDDISLHIDELTKHPMNGRQIRNTITTARQLAKFMGKKMVFSHLQRTIAITNKFDEYLADVREADVEEHVFDAHS